MHPYILQFSATGSTRYELAIYLLRTVLSPVLVSSSHIENSQNSHMDQHNIAVGEVLISFVMESQFTKVPMTESIEMTTSELVLPPTRLIRNRANTTFFVSPR
jgi:hypothetical protein